MGISTGVSVVGDQVGAYTSLFKSDMVVNDIYRVQHPFNTRSVVAQVYDENNQTVLPTEIRIVSNSIVDIDLTGADGINGEWRVTILSSTGGTRQIRSFTQNFTQSDISPEEDITFVHNIGSEGVFVQVFDNNLNLTLPSSIDILDPNRVKVSVAGGAPLTGSWSVQILGEKVEPQAIFSYARSFREGGLVAGILEVEHMLNTLNVVVQVYDDNHQLILPTEITRVGLNTVSVSFVGAEEEISGEWQVTVVAANEDPPIPPETVVSTTVPAGGTSVVDTVTTENYNALSYFMAISGGANQSCFYFNVLARGGVPPDDQVFSQLGVAPFFNISTDEVNEKTRVLVENLTAGELQVVFKRSTL